MKLRLLELQLAEVVEQELGLVLLEVDMEALAVAFSMEAEVREELLEAVKSERGA